MLKQSIAAPPILDTLSLDDHARRFFQGERCGPVDARLRLDHRANPAYRDRVFVGRIARFCTGAPVVDTKAPLLVSALAMPFNKRDPGERPQVTRRFFAQSLEYPGAPASRDWWGRVPTLRDCDLFAGFTRLHFDSGFGLGVAVLPGQLLPDGRAAGDGARESQGGRRDRAWRRPLRLEETKGPGAGLRGDER